VAVKDVAGQIGGLPPVAAAVSFVSRALGRNDKPGGSGTSPKPRS